MFKKILFSLLLITSDLSFAMELSPEEQLHQAAREGNLELVKKLVTIDQVPVDSRDKDQQTPLICAAMYGHVPVCEFLLDSGADIEAKDKYNTTPLSAANIKHYDTIALLLKRGAQVNAGSTFNQTPLYYAAGACEPKTCLLLLEYGADPRIQESRWLQTPLIKLSIRPLSTFNTSEYGLDCEKRIETCFQILDYLNRRNQAIITTLLCLNRISKNPPDLKTKMIFGALYRQFKKLLLPYLGKYIPIIPLLAMKDNQGYRACDNFLEDLLNPETVFEALQAESAKRNTVAQEHGGWFDTCTIQ